VSYAHARQRTTSLETLLSEVHVATFQTDRHWEKEASTQLTSDPPTFRLLPARLERRRFSLEERMKYKRMKYPIT
jgi:hypothetical protein